jgi:hypothetical protein
MIEYPMTYTDFDGNERKETFCFNLTPAEIADMQYATSGGFSEMLTRVVDSKDVPRIAEMFKKIIRESYGEKSPDGKYFKKRAADGHLLADDFAQTQAYSDFYMKLATDATEAARFVRGITPASPSEDTSGDKKATIVDKPSN